MRAYDIVVDGGTLTAAVTTLVEFTAPATKSVIITRAWVSQGSNTTSAQQRIQILRKSAAGTNVGTATAVPTDAGDTAFGGTVRALCTVLGTLGVIPITDSFNWQNGWLWLPVPEERIVVPGGGIVGLHLPVAPAALTVQCGISVLEIG